MWMGIVATALAGDLAAPAYVPPHREQLWNELVRQGHGQNRGNPVPAPHQNLGNSPRPLAGAGPATLFLNFDGAMLVNNGQEDARINATLFSDFAGAYPPYGGDAAARQSVIDAVRSDWRDINVRITDVRPTSGEYAMNMVGPHPRVAGSSVLGVALLDCGNEMTMNNITYAFHGANDGFSSAITATTISQEVAHGFGLEHVDEPSDIMNPFNAGGDPAFMNACIQIVSNGGPVQCGS